MHISKLSISYAVYIFLKALRVDMSGRKIMQAQRPNFIFRIHFLKNPGSCNPSEVETGGSLGLLTSQSGLLDKVQACFKKKEMKEEDGSWGTTLEAALWPPHTSTHERNQCTETCTKRRHSSGLLRSLCFMNCAVLGSSKNLPVFLCPE